MARQLTVTRVCVSYLVQSLLVFHAMHRTADYALWRAISHGGPHSSRRAWARARALRLYGRLRWPRSRAGTGSAQQGTEARAPERHRLNRPVSNSSSCQPTNYRRGRATKLLVALRPAAVSPGRLGTWVDLLYLNLVNPPLVVWNESYPFGSSRADMPSSRTIGVD